MVNGNSKTQEDKLQFYLGYNFLRVRRWRLCERAPMKCNPLKFCALCPLERFAYGLLRVVVSVFHLLM